MTDLEQAKSLLENGGYTCVLCKGDIAYTSSINGISPMVDFLADGTDLNGFSAADKIIGKAAAMLFVLAGIKEVYALVISTYAIEVFKQYNVKYYYGAITEAISNRAGTGLCPMEQAVKEISEPKEAFTAIKYTLNNLKTRRI